jgi:hypothetical protein
VIQTVIDVVMNQGLLGLAHSFLDRVQLLGNVEARSSVFDHPDDGPQVTLDPS